MKRNRDILGIEPAQRREILNLQNWLSDSGCIARDETQYLDDQRDLMNLGGYSVDRALNRLQGPIEDTVIWLSKKFVFLEKLVSPGPPIWEVWESQACNDSRTKCNQNVRSNASDDAKIFIMVEPLLSLLGRLLMACSLAVALFIPLVIVQSIRPVVPRFLATFVGVTSNTVLLSWLTCANTFEMYLAGAT